MPRFHPRYALVIALAVILVGCSDPKGYEVGKLTEEQRKELGKKLNAEEGQKLAAWVVRKAMTGKDLPTGITVSQALKEQDEWAAKLKEEEAKAEELKKRVEAERKAKQEEFAKTVAVALVGKRNSSGEYGQRFINLDIAFENKTDKDILGIKGVLRLTDMFGDKVMDIRWSFDDGVAARTTYLERGGGLKANQFMDEHAKLWNMDAEKVKGHFDVQTIIFKDGTKLEAPK